MKWKILLIAILIVMIGCVGGIGLVKLLDYCPWAAYTLGFAGLTVLIYLRLTKEDGK